MSLVRRSIPPLFLAIAALAAVPAFGQTTPTVAPKRDWADYYMVRVDPDKKGYFTLDDARRYAAAQFERLDANHDGVLDHDEFVASLTRSIARSTSEENKARMERSLTRRDTLFHTIDQKGDGKITKEEYLAAATQHFNDLDIDKAGKITTAELRTAHHGL